MKAILVAMASAAVACSSAPAPERSAHADGPVASDDRADGGASAREDAAAGAEAPAAAVDDVTGEAIASMRQRFGCTRAGPAVPGSHGVACELLRRFAGGREPRLRTGALPGVALSFSPDAIAPDLARPALLAVRGDGDALEVAWGIASPADPRDATELSAMAADVLEGRAPAFPLAAWPGLTWTRARPTRGASLAIAAEPLVLARSEGEATLVLVLDAEAPVVALHRAGAEPR